MIEGKGKCLNFVCFEPQKKQQLDDLLGSPVKVSKTRASSKSSDLILVNESEVIPVEKMDYDFIDMHNLKVSDLTNLAEGCLVTIEVKTRSKELESSRGLAYQVLSVADTSGVIKVMLWGEEFLNKVEEGKSYKFENV